MTAILFLCRLHIPRLSTGWTLESQGNRKEEPKQNKSQTVSSYQIPKYAGRKSQPRVSTVVTPRKQKSTVVISPGGKSRPSSAPSAAYATGVNRKWRPASTARGALDTLPVALAELFSHSQEEDREGCSGTHTCTHTHSHIHTYTLTYTLTQTYTLTYKLTHTCSHIHLHTHIHIHFHTYSLTYTYTHVLSHIHSYIHIHSHTRTHSYRPQTFIYIHI